MRLRQGGKGKRETDAAAACNGEKWPNFGVCNGEGGRREEGVEFVPRPSEWREDWVAKKQGGG